MDQDTTPNVHTAEPDVVRMCRDLIRINTSNPTHSERSAADYVSDALSEVGIRLRRFEPEPGRTSVVARVPGRDRDLPPLLIHAHLDVVPAREAEWTEDPFSGAVRDGYVWGRGALDMKNMVASTLDCVRGLRREGRMPRRDLILAFFADEEAGGRLGAAHVVVEHPELFAGCEEAIGEVGGFSHRLGPERNCYFISTGEKGVCWLRISATGRAGHSSLINKENAVASLCRAVSNIAEHRFVEDRTRTTSLFLESLASALGQAAEQVDPMLTRLGALSRMMTASFQDTVNPTSVTGGYKVNVIPSTAEATIDGRFLPGHGEQFYETVVALAGSSVDVETIHFGQALEFPWKVPLVDAMEKALRGEDSTALVVPFLGTAFTDAKWLSKLGIRCYGFCPLQLPDSFDFTALFHGVDERVPVTGLQFSVSVLEHLLESY